MNFRNFATILILLVVVPISGIAQPGIDTLSLKTIFAEPYLPGVRPIPTGFHPNNRTVFFTWNDSSLSRDKTFRVDIDGRNLREAESTESVFRFATYSPDRRRMLFTESGNLMIANADGTNRRVLAADMGASSNAVWSSKGDKVAFNARGNVWIIDVNQPQVQQITHKASNAPNFSIRSWANNDTRIVVSTTDNSQSREVYFPTYLGKFVTPGGSRRGVATVELHLIDIESRGIKTLLSGKISLRGVVVSPSGRYLVIDKSDEFLKEREIASFDLQNDNAYTVLFSDTTEGWIFSSFGDVGFAPTSDVISFSSEQQGWNNLYLVNPDGSNLRQVTSGNWETTWFSWLDDHRILYASNETDPGERHLHIADLRRNTHTKLTESPDFRTGFTLSHDKNTVVYRRTSFNQPDDLYAINLSRPRGEVRLTNTVPDRFKQVQWQMPEYIRFTGRDGETALSMELIKPYNFDSTQKYPVVVFVHGAGSLQNVYKGWSNNYWREYLFHHFLAREGYVVIEVDFRHSTGYGRKFREDVTNWMGKYELEDIIDGIDYVAKDGYLDINRVGVYGGSYGGFMALYALHLAPDRFHVGAALRAVTNWENYYYANPWYTGPRLGHPDTHRENYDRSSPLTFADSLSRPALILHGLIDDNVGFQDAMQYVERLIQSGNEQFDLMVYPSERHSFTSPAAWYDEYRRIFEYFEKYLK